VAKAVATVAKVAAMGEEGATETLAEEDTVTVTAMGHRRGVATGVVGAGVTNRDHLLREATTQDGTAEAAVRAHHLLNAISLYLHCTGSLHTPYKYPSIILILAFGQACSQGMRPSSSPFAASVNLPGWFSKATKSKWSVCMLATSQQGSSSGIMVCRRWR